MILTFHRIVEIAERNIDVDIFTFKRCLHFLRSFDVVHLDDYEENNPRQAVIRFDDGTKDLLTAAPLLKAWNYPFEVFICGDFVERGGMDYLNEYELRQVVEYGGHLQYHSKSHPDLTQIPETALDDEIHCDETLKALDPKGFKWFAYPYWRWNDTVRNVVKTYYKGAVSGNGFARQGDSYALDAARMENEKYLPEIFNRKDIIIKYIEPYVPVSVCNFRCKYCYVGHTFDQNKGTLPEWKHPPEYTAKALGKKRLGGTSLIWLCGAGETLIPKEMPAYIKAFLAEGHFVGLVSNMSLSNRIDEILDCPAEWRQRLFFKASFHWHELKRLNLFDVFERNVKKALAEGASVSVEITPYDALIPDIEEIKIYSMKHFGALPHITVARDEINRRSGLPRYSRLSAQEYRKVWGSFNSELFDFKDAIFEKPVRGFCYAGQWRYTMGLVSGDLWRCYDQEFVQNIYADTEAPLIASPVGRNCAKVQPHCYNGHALLAYGCVPEMRYVPSYADVRDRICSDGSHWLTPRMAAFFAQRLDENNPRDKNAEKRKPLNISLIKPLLRKIYRFLRKAVNFILPAARTGLL